MPWHIGTSDECPASKPYAVIKDADESVAGCHETRKEAEAQMAALYASDKMEPMKATYLKAEQLSTTKWRVLGIPFGGPLKDGKDLDAEFFTIRTDIKPDWYDRRPLVWHHNLDKTMEADSTIGTADELTLDEKLGWWSTLWLDRSHRYWVAVNELLGRGKIYGSSGSLPNFIQVDHKTGEIKVWPYVEQTLTPIPSNFFSQVAPAKALAHFDEAGLSLTPAMRDLITDLDSHAADLRPDLATAADAATLRRLSGELSALLERTNHIR